MTAKQTKIRTRLRNVLWGLIGALASGVIFALFVYAKDGIVGGYNAEEKITTVNKKIDEHITCHKGFEMGIELRLKDKVDREDEAKLDNRLNRIENLLLSNSKLLRETKQDVYKVRNQNQYGLHLDTLKP